MRREREAANRRYAGFTAGVLFSVLALTATVWLMRPADLDAATLCPTNRPLAGHTVVIVDRTDRWTTAMGAALTQLVENAQRDTDRYEKFSIVSLDANQSVHPLFSICNPGTPTFWSDLYRGRRYTTRDFEQRFVGAAERVIEDVREPSEASSSPIVEYVHRWLGSDDFNATVPHRRLILVSDMRQNSDLYSIYSGAEDQLGDVVARQFGPSAEGVSFDVYFVAHGRDHNVSEDEVRTAWDHAFGRIGADYSWRQIS
ncbi:MAG: hypothetical protein KA153_07065 [Hyphomonadaceae bacterium]|jgi:hypothetical protein|nr:hypothetical protein [Hyphomonadaceae bacterium]